MAVQRWLRKVALGINHGFSHNSNDGLHPVILSAMNLSDIETDSRSHGKTKFISSDRVQKEPYQRWTTDHIFNTNTGHRKNFDASKSLRLCLRHDPIASSTWREI